MKFFHMHASKKQLKEGVFVNFIDDKVREFMRLIDGVKAEKKVEAPLKFIMTKRGKAKKFFPEELEYFNLGGGGILIHCRAKKIFESLTKHHTMYKSEIEYRSENLEGSFYTMNLEILYPAADLIKSNCYKDLIRGEEKILAIDHLVLSRQKLSQIPKDEHLFRLAEYTPVTIIDEYGKNLIEEAKIIGVEFDELEVV